MNANRGTLRVLGLAILTFIPYASLASEPRLLVDWPAGWEFRQTAHDERQAVYVQGRQRSNDRVQQELAMTVIGTATAREPVTNPSIRDLVHRLHRRFPVNTSVGEIRPFAHGRGYYFVLTDARTEESSPYGHLIEGAMLDSGYIIEFVLRSSDAHAPDTLAMLSALEKFEIR